MNAPTSLAWGGDLPDVLSELVRVREHVRRGHPITVELHRGAAGTDGPLLATVVESSADPDQGGTATIDGKVIRDIRENPGHFYLEVLKRGVP